MTRTIELAIEEGDVKTFTADVLALKYAQDFHGADRVVAKALTDAGFTLDMLRGQPGKHHLVSTREAIQAPFALFIGVAPMYELSYQHIQAFARDVLSILASEAPRTAMS
jgi:hypothetical protein